MASYKLSLKPSVEKDVRSLTKESLARVWAQIRALANNPLPKNAVKLTGSEQLYRVRAGDYRIIYSVDSQAHEVTVQHVRHRREAYRDL
ncbi:MAG: type II toxin-antitoxin system RelE/ParE family toxin [Acidobacteria bacterium]|nr:MAG: type II toxin-antitoxin system RelE/ParE family toxin [Acidobacteriota bacterium]